MIDLKNIYKIYGKSTENIYALNDITLNIKRGEFVSIVGKSGSGKTTLMNILGCLDSPTNGRYFLDNSEITGLEIDDLYSIRNRKIGFIFQDFNLIPRLSALENVELPLMFRGIAPKKRTQLATNALKQVCLHERLFHRPCELSGGQQQRVAIARAIVTDPCIILADEPTGNLDAESTLTVMDILNKFQKGGATIILITHDLLIAKTAQRIIHIEKGKIY